MYIQSTQGWSTSQEGTHNFLYRSVSTVPLTTLEPFIQQLNQCKNPDIAIPELVRLGDGDIYFREPRGVRSVEDFLETAPSTSAKLFVLQQLIKLLDNLHTFVGIAHGGLHIGCLSIDSEDTLVLGGITPSMNDFEQDVISLAPLLEQFLSEPNEEDILNLLRNKPLPKMRRRIQQTLANNEWEQVVSDWEEAINQTILEESSEDFSAEDGRIETPVLPDALEIFEEVPSADMLLNPSVDSVEETAFGDIDFWNQEEDIEEIEETLPLPQSFLSDIPLSSKDTSQVSLEKVTLSQSQDTLQSFELSEVQEEDELDFFETALEDLLPEYDDYDDDELFDFDDPSEELTLTTSNTEIQETEPIGIAELSVEEELEWLSDETESFAIEDFSPDAPTEAVQQNVSFFDDYAEEESNKWLWVAGFAVVSGGVWALIPTEQVIEPLVLNEVDVPTEVNTAETLDATTPNENTFQNSPIGSMDKAFDSTSEKPTVVPVIEKKPQNKPGIKTKSESKKTPPQSSISSSEKQVNKREIATPFKKVTTEPLVNTYPKTVAELPEPKKGVAKAEPKKGVTKAETKKVVTKTKGKVIEPLIAANPIQTVQERQPLEQKVSSVEKGIKNLEITETPEVIVAQQVQAVEEVNPWNSTKESATKESSTTNTDTLPLGIEMETEQSSTEVEAVSESSKRVEERLTKELNQFSKSANLGVLEQSEIEKLSTVSATSPNFTRANAILLTQGQRSNNTGLISQSLEKILSVDSNQHIPVFLLAMAQHMFNQQDFDTARTYLVQAETNWGNTERDQLMILRAQRDNIVAHLSYIHYLETGSDDSRMQSMTQFRKVQREARRAKLLDLYERAEGKMNSLRKKS